MEDAWLGKATERIFLPLLQKIVPEVTDMNLPVEGIFHNFAFFSIDKRYPGHARKVMSAVWGMGLLMFSKFVVVFDADVDIQNLSEVIWRIGNNVDPRRDVLFVEASLLRGGGKGLIMTGQIGPVMQESMQAALAWVRAHAAEFGIDADFFQSNDIHIHVPAGAIPKDGPSAGITMATAIASALSGIPARRDLAMTGEITLRGRVLPIGGLKEKILAAKRAKLSTVILPRRNKKDLEEIPKHLLKGIAIAYAETMDDVMKIALRRKKPAPAASKPQSSPPTTARSKPVRPASHRRSPAGRPAHATLMPPVIHRP